MVFMKNWLWFTIGRVCSLPYPMRIYKWIIIKNIIGRKRNDRCVKWWYHLYSGPLPIEKQNYLMVIFTKNVLNLSEQRSERKKIPSRGRNEGKRIINRRRNLFGWLGTCWLRCSSRPALIWTEWCAAGDAFTESIICEVIQMTARISTEAVFTWIRDSGWLTGGSLCPSAT